MERWTTRPLAEVCDLNPPKREVRQKLSVDAQVSFVPMEQLGICQKSIQSNGTRSLGEVYGGYTYFAERDVLLAKITPCFENGSVDDSLEVLREVAKDDKRVVVISLARNFGQHPAISAGFEMARGQFVVLMDADLQDRPEDIPALLARFKPGIDVTDVRQVKGLEFDYVILVDVTASQYPADDESRHLLHIGATRAAHQLWVVSTGTPSPLLPAYMFDDPSL